MRADPTYSDSLRLSDGRRLSYTVTGPATGTPVLYCHGAIGTSVRRAVDLEAIADELAIRYIAVSRPGLGTSDPSPGRTVAAFARDIGELADALSLGSLHVVGVSAGGPYALAVAAAMPDRVPRVAACSSLSPLCSPHRAPGVDRRIRLGLAAVARAPRAVGAAGDAVLPVIRRRPGLLSSVIVAHAARCERERLLQPAEREAASSAFLEATTGGVRGMIEDYLTCSREWGFSLAEVDAEVHLWHGGRDPLVPIEHALQLSIALRRCRMFLDPDEGHHFFRSRLREILAVLVGREPQPGPGIATSLPEAHPAVPRPRRRRRGALRR